MANDPTFFDDRGTVYKCSRNRMDVEIRKRDANRTSSSSYSIQ